MKRLLKLGFFVGLGAGAAVAAACGSTVTRTLDASPADSAAVDSSGPDSGASDAGPDRGSPDAARDAGGKKDSRGWDIPLE